MNGQQTVPITTDGPQGQYVEPTPFSLSIMIWKLRSSMTSRISLGIESSYLLLLPLMNEEPVAFIKHIVSAFFFDGRQQENKPAGSIALV